MNVRTSKLARLSITLFSLFVALGAGITSCVSPKTIVYFQGDSLKYSAQAITQNYVPTIQPNDLLSIVVGSLNNEANEIFNAPNLFTTFSTNYAATGGARTQPLGYLVSVDGTIEIPLVGKVAVGGLTTTSASDTIRKRLLTFLKEPSVMVRNLNFKVSVLGEVVRPAVYVIPDEKITLPEVLSLAGDLTIYGKRSNVMIIREEKGERKYARINLTSREVFDSPYYYLHKNDIVYIEPTKTRMNATDRTVQLAPLIISLASVLSLILYRF